MDYFLRLGFTLGIVGVILGIIWVAIQPYVESIAQLRLVAP